jgi:hypothetical protein
VETGSQEDESEEAAQQLYIDFVNSIAYLQSCW